MITLEITGVEELAKRLGVDLTPALRAATFAIGEIVRSKIAKPPGSSHSPVIWASRKQKIWYAIMRRQGGLPLQYSRGNDPMSQKLEQSWTVESLGETDAIVGTKGVTYAKWVQGEAWQSAQHRATGWVTDKQAIEQAQQGGDIPKVINDALSKPLNAGVG